MARREATISKAVEERELAVAVDNVNVDPIADMYETGEWKGLPQWRCKLCPWDTLEGETSVRQHILQEHLAPKIQKRPPSQIVRADRFGNPVKSEVP